MKEDSKKKKKRKKSKSAEKERGGSIPVSKIDLRDRRYDSFAWALQGDDTCAATCYAGGQLLIATNKAIESSWIKATKKYLKYIAAKELSEMGTFLPPATEEVAGVGSMSGSQMPPQLYSASLFDSSPSAAPSFSASVSADPDIIIQRFIDEDPVMAQLLSELGTEHSDPSINIHPTYYDDLNRSLSKLTHSILVSSKQHPKALLTTLLDVLANDTDEDPRIIFIEREPQKSGQDEEHAEMRILGELLRMKKASTLPLGQPFYIGTSLPCCKKCATIIRAVNHTMKDIIIIHRGGGNGVDYPAGLPFFFTYKAGILTEAEYEQIDEFFKSQYGGISIEESYSNKTAPDMAALPHAKSPSPELLALREKLATPLPASSTSIASEFSPGLGLSLPSVPSTVPPIPSSFSSSMHTAPSPLVPAGSEYVYPRDLTPFSQRDEQQVFPQPGAIAHFQSWVPYYQQPTTYPPSYPPWQQFPYQDQQSFLHPTIAYPYSPLDQQPPAYPLAAPLWQQFPYQDQQFFPHTTIAYPYPPPDQQPTTYLDTPPGLLSSLTSSMPTPYLPPPPPTRLPLVAAPIVSPQSGLSPSTVFSSTPTSLPDPMPLPRPIQPLPALSSSPSLSKAEMASDSHSAKVGKKRKNRGKKKKKNAQDKQKHLKRYEKSAVMDSNCLEEYNLADKLSKSTQDYNIGSLKKHSQKLAMEDMQTLLTQPAAIEPIGSIKLIPEMDHGKQHGNNVDQLIARVKAGEIDQNSVICLERKQLGSNLGMADIIMLAQILKHNENNSEQLITIPKWLENSLIYKDAQLYKVARDNGIAVIGIEGKGLEYTKEFILENHKAARQVLARLQNEKEGVSQLATTDAPELQDQIMALNEQIDKQKRKVQSIDELAEQIPSIIGKDIDKNSVLYDAAREKHMTVMLKQIASTGRSVIFPVGAEHIEALETQLKLKGIGVGETEVVVVSPPLAKKPEEQGLPDTLSVTIRIPSVIPHNYFKTII